MDVELVAPRRVTVCIDGRETQVRAGSGIVGHLAQEEDSLAFLQRVKQVFQVECLMHNELLGRPVQSVVFCGGAGGLQPHRTIRLWYSGHAHHRP